MSNFIREFKEWIIANEIRPTAQHDKKSASFYYNVKEYKISDVNYDNLGFTLELIAIRTIDEDITETFPLALSYVVKTGIEPDPLFFGEYEKLEDTLARTIDYELITAMLQDIYMMPNGLEKILNIGDDRITAIYEWGLFHYSNLEIENDDIMSYMYSKTLDENVIGPTIKEFLLI